MHGPSRQRTTVVLSISGNANSRIVCSNLQRHAHGGPCEREQSVTTHARFEIPRDPRPIGTLKLTLYER